LVLKLNILGHGFDTFKAKPISCYTISYIIPYNTRVCVQLFKCLHGMAPDYLSTMCHPVSRLAGRQNLRSANRGQLDVPRATLSSYGVRAFAHAGPSLWNTLPLSQEPQSDLQLSCAILSLNSFLSTDFVSSAFGV